MAFEKVAGFKGDGFRAFGCGRCSAGCHRSQGIFKFDVRRTVESLFGFKAGVWCLGADSLIGFQHYSQYNVLDPRTVKQSEMFFESRMSSSRGQPKFAHDLEEAE